MFQKYRIHFFVLLFLTTEVIAAQRLACFYYDRNNPHGDVNRISLKITAPTLLSVWAKDHSKKDLLLNGETLNGFFEVSDISQTEARNLCKETLRELFPDANIQLMHMAVKPSFWSDYIPAVFLKDEINRYNKLVVFGDSLSDQGRFRDMIKVIPPRPYFAGRFTNIGGNWVDYFQDAVGIAVQNHATAGSLSGPFPNINFNAKKQWSRRISDDIGSYFSGTLRDQLRSYRKKINIEDIQPEKTLFVVWAGSNDYFTMIDHDEIADLFLDNPDHAFGYKNIINHVTDNIATMIKDLYDLGARRFLIPNLPSLGKIPKILENRCYAKGEPEPKRLISLSKKMNFIADQHNSILAQKIEDIKSNFPQIDIILVDMAGYLKSAMLPHLEKEISYEGDCAVIGQACYVSSGTYLSVKERSIGQPDLDVFFLDPVHPTTYGHRILAGIMLLEAARSSLIESSLVQQYLNKYRSTLPKCLLPKAEEGKVEDWPSS